MTPRLVRNGGVSKFACSISRRYEGLHGRQPSVWFVFRQTRPSVMLVRVYQPIQVHLSPRFTLTVPSASTLRGPAPLTFVRQIETQVLRQQIVQSVQEHWQFESFVHRLAAREIRVDSAAAADVATALIKAVSPVPLAAASPASPAVSWVTAQPVARVLRRAAVTPASESAATPPANSAHATRAEARRENTWQSSPQAPGPVDLNHLTEQVVQAIDRRMIAHRERRGRV